MVLRNPSFAEELVSWVGFAVTLVCVIVDLWALIHCALQRSDAFAAVGTLSKGMWLALLAGSMLLTIVLALSPFGQMFALIAVTAALVCLLDVRPAVRDISSGGGG